ncbi:glutaminase A [Mycolicibacterium bacteremicum]|uniref:glutaminase n=1 Tax=Mycolicibacterium bacteremicum TaxID=564198 RepID=A0A1W9YPM0_MYCBA|nr:glutaminase A [Mycolicibacterium bacteremicum]
MVEAAHRRCRADTAGAVADYIPVLAEADPNWFGVCVAEVDGGVHTSGDCDIEFSIQSISKAFVYALVCEELGHQAVAERIGVNNTGLPFNSVIAIELNNGHPMNPMVNAGAIATTALIPGEAPQAQWEHIVRGLSEFAGRPLELDETVYQSEAQTNQRNRAIARLLESYGRLDLDPLAVVDVYTRQCALRVTAKDLAIMGATLADGGVNPVTGRRVVSAGVCRDTLAVLAATGVGSLGSARALSGVCAFLIGGTLGTFVGWRPVFVIVLVLAVAVFLFSFRLHSAAGDKSVDIDVFAALLIGVAIVSLTLGFNNLNGWGVFQANPEAPFDLLGLSPAPVLVLIGIVLGQAFFVWTRHRTRTGKVPLVSLSVLGSSRERAAVYAMFIVVALEAALNFTVPLYIQIVQGRTPFDTSMAMLPFNLTVSITATLVVRFYKRFTPRTIGVFSFTLTTVALVWLSVVVTNNWETAPTIIGLIVFGIGQGALVTLVFNVLVTAAPKELAGDVGSVRGTTQNLASAVGTALAGAMLVGILSLNVGQAVINDVEIPDRLIAQVDLDQVNFVSNDQLREVLSRTDASQSEVDAAVQINTDARLRALKLGLLILAGISVVAILPASRLPGYRPGEIPEKLSAAVPSGDGPPLRD